jgi:hypothetical protein
MKKLLLLCFVMAVASSCNRSDQKDSSSTKSDTLRPSTVPPAVSQDGLNQQDSIKATGRQVLIFLKEKNYNELSKYFSNEGVRFSPYGYIDTLTAKKLTSTDFLTAISKNWVLTWGAADGTGDPIKLSVKAYLNRFVYNADYLSAEAVGYDEILKTGNSKHNHEQLYPKHHFIDYHFSGFDQKLEGMDWATLRLVFEKQDGQYFLVAIVHDQWTI